MVAPLPACVRAPNWQSRFRAARAAALASDESFEALLARISNRFVEAPIGELNGEIAAAIGAVAQMEGAERAHVYLFDSDRATMNEIARWPAGGTAEEDQHFQSIPSMTLPFYAQEVFALRPISFSSADELPEWAVAERRFLDFAGVRSGATMPMQAADGTIGTLTMTTLTHARHWSAWDLSRLDRVARVVAPALMRTKAEYEHLESLRFERLMTALVAEFMNLPADELADGLERALETIARSVDCDRAALFIVDDALGYARAPCGWWAPGAQQSAPAPFRVDTSPGSLHRRWLDSDEPHLVLSAADVERIRPDAVDSIRRAGLGTVANLPLVIEGRRAGWFGIGAALPRIGWSAAELKCLGLAANTLANMYARMEAVEELRRRQRFNDALAIIAVEFIKRPSTQLKLGIAELMDGIGSYTRSERAAVMWIDDREGTVSTYHEWAARSAPARITGFPLSEAPWFHQNVLTQRNPWYVHVEDIPRSDRRVAETLDAIGVRTLLNCTIGVSDQVFGYSCLGYAGTRHRPPAGTEQVLAMASGVIANALARERLEANSLQQHEALARAQRLSSLGQMAAGIAHDLGQPLTAIIGFGRACQMLLAKRRVDRVEVTRLLDAALSEAKRAGGIIHSLREHLAGRRTKPTPVHVGDIVMHLLPLVEAIGHSQRVTIETAIPAALPPVIVEASDIGQVIINLVQNAVASIVAGDADVREVRISARREGAYVMVDVADCGPGFADSDPELVFDPFYSTKPGGLGLGLSVSRALARANGGDLLAVPTAVGARLRISLPIAPGRRRQGADSGTNPRSR